MRWCIVKRDDGSAADADEAHENSRETSELIGAGIAVTHKELRVNFHLPLHTVAKKFGMCTTAFKKLCRRYGIAKWPHRQLRGIDMKIAALKAELNYSTVEKESSRRNLVKLEEKKAKLSQGAEPCLERTILEQNTLMLERLESLVVEISTHNKGEYTGEREEGRRALL